MSKPKSVLSLIKEKGEDAFLKDVYFSPNIPANKLAGAVKGVTDNSVRPEHVYLVYDSTFFGGAGEGVVLSRDRIFYKSLGSDPKSICYSDIKVVSANSEKEGEEPRLLIYGRDGSFWIIENESNIDKEKLAALLIELKKVHISSRKEGPPIENKPLVAMPVEIQQKSVLSLIMEKGEDAFLKDVYFSPNIPANKLAGAVQGVTDNSVRPEHVYLVYDSTLFGGAGEGVVLSRDRIFYKSFGSDPKSICYSDIKDVSANSEKEGEEPRLLIYGKDGSFWIIENESDIDKEKLAALLIELKKAHISSRKEGPKIENKPLVAMPVEIRMAYVKTALNFLLAEDGTLHEKDFVQLYALIARLELGPEQRMELLFYPDKQEETDSLTEEMTRELDELARRDVLFSLEKDLVFLQLQAKGRNNSSGWEFIADIAQKHGIKQEQFDVIVQTVENDLLIFDDDVDDEELEDGMRNIAEKSSTVGLPLDSLYISGSTTGLSPTIMTFLFPGIGLNLFMYPFGGFVFDIYRYFKTMREEDDKRARKQAMLQEVNGQIQKSINMLVQDINLVMAKLVECMDRAREQAHRNEVLEDRLRGLVARLKSMTAGSVGLCVERNEAELSALRQRIHRILSVEEMKRFLDGPGAGHRDRVLGLYKERRVPDGGKPVYVLRGDITKEDASFLAFLFKQGGQSASAAGLGLSFITSFGRGFW